MNLLSPSPSPGFFRTLTVSLLSFAILVMPLASVAVALPVKAAPAAPAVKSESVAPESATPASESVLAGAKAEAKLSTQAKLSAQPLFMPLAGGMTATLAAALVATANNGNGQADPGDIINYTATLNNGTGSDATGLTFSLPLDSHVTLTPGSVQSTPVAFDQLVTTNEDTGVQITLSGQDPDGSNLTFVSISSPTNGSLGTWSAPDCATTPGVCTTTATYTPNSNYFGSDSFTFRVNDGTANSNETGTVSITVNGINDPPTFTQSGGNQTISEDPTPAAQSVSSFITAVSPGPANESSQTVSFPIITNSNPDLFSVQPSINVSGATATLTYTPGVNRNGTATITYKAQDNGGTANGGDDDSATQSFTITVNAVNDPPVAANTAFTAQTNMKISGMSVPLASATDPDKTNGDLSYTSQDDGYTPTFSVTPNSIVTGGATPCPAGTTISNVNNTNGTFDFDPAPGFTGSCTLVYKVRDSGNPGTADSANATITVTVSGPIIWFVDPNRASNGNGTLSNTSNAVGPFNNLADAEAKLATLALNQRVFVYSGQTASGTAITLRGSTTGTQAQAQAAAHWLIGQGVVGTNFDTVFGIMPPTGTISRPNISNTPGTANGMRPTIRGTVTMKENTIVKGLNIDVSAVGGSPKGINATSLAGGSSGSVLVITDVNVTSAGGNAVDITTSSGTSSVTYTTSNQTTSPNIIVSTTGIALNVVSTTIGTGNMTFRSISSNGAPNGIILSNTGTTAGTHGGLIVTGNSSGFCGGNIVTSTSTFTAPNAADCSGGRIQNTTGGGDTSPTDNAGIGIRLVNTRAVSLTRMRIDNHSNFAIYGNNVHGFTLTDSLIDGTNGSDAAHDESAITFDNLLGSAAITRCAISGGHEDTLDVENSTGTLDRLTITNTNFGTQSTNFGEDGLVFSSTSGPTMKLTVDSCRFQHGRSDLLQSVARDTSTLETVIKNSVFDNDHPNILSGGGGIVVEADAAGDSPTHNFNISNNTFRDAVGLAVNIYKGPGTGSMSGTIHNNTIGVSGVLKSGSQQAGGINVDGDGNGSITVAITNNTIRQWGDGDAIHLNTGNSESAGNPGDVALNATVTGNLAEQPVVPPNGFATNAFELNGGTNTGNSNQICLNVQNNTFGNGGGTGEDDINIRQRFDSTVRMPGYDHVANGSKNTGAVQTYMVSRNPGTPPTPPTAIASASANPAPSGFFNTVPANSACAQPPVLTGFMPNAAEQRYYLAFLNNDSDSLFAFLKDETDLASIFDGINNAEPSAPTALAASSAEPAQVSGETVFVETSQAFDTTGAEVNSAIEERTNVTTAASGRIWNKIAAASHAGRATEATESVYVSRNDSTQEGELFRKVSYQPSAESLLKEEAGALPGDDVSLSHGTSVPARQTPHAARMLALFSPPPGTFPVNGVGSGFRLPNGKTTTITFQVTVNNPPNMAGVNPPRIIHQGQLSGAFIGNPTVTDDPATVGTPDDPTVTLVDLFDSQTALVSSADPANSGETVTFTATITPTGAPLPPAGTNPTGTVDFLNGASVIAGCDDVPVTSGQAQCATAALPIAGSPHSITAVYSGDGNFSTSTSNTVSQDINSSGTTTSVTSSQDPSLVTENVTFTATVTSNSTFTGPPTGTVTFSIDGNPLTCDNGSTSVQTLSGGTATCQTNDLAAADYNITAAYSGDANFTASNNNATPFVQTVNKSNTTTALQVSAPTSSPGENVTLTATVTSQTSVTGPITGTVTFMDGANPITCDSGTALSGGVATCVTNDLTEAGSPHSLTAVYSGDATFLTSTSGPVSHTVASCSASAVVTNTSDSGAGSLRQAISAGVCVGGTITFNIPTSDPGYDSGTGVYTIELTDANGELLVDKNLTITGLGANKLTVRRDDAATTDFRVFHISNGLTVNISGMTIANGNLSAGLGGGILNDRSSLTLDGVAVQQNSAPDGGGVYNDGGASGDSATLTITNSTLSGNTATSSGGAIFNNASGGGTAALTITNSTLSGNSANVNGGGVHNEGAAATATLTSVTVTGNTADKDNNGSGAGGGIYVDPASGATAVMLKNTIVAGNFTGAGGGVAQVETATVAGTITAAGAGNAQVVVTAAGMTNSPKTVLVPVANNDTAADVAGKMRTALAADADVSAFFTVSGSGDQIVLTRIAPAANDATMNIATDNADGAGGSVGLTPSPTSADTTAGVAPASSNDISGTVDAASSFNLIGNAATSGGLMDATNNNIVGNAGAGTIAIATILNTTLANNGGPTQTHALVNNSPALEKGNAFTLTTDQRGFPRTVNTDATAPVSPYDDTDIGAFEAQNAAQPPNTPVLDPASDSGTAGDNITNDVSPSFQISGVTQGAFVELRRGGTTIVASGIAPAGGTITLTDPGPLAPGPYSYDARQTLGPDTSAFSAAQTITINLIPNAPDLVDASDTGADNQDNITNDNSPTFDISGVVNGATVELLRATGANPPVVVASGVAAGNTITLTDPGPVASGTHTYTARQTVGGNTGLASPGLDVTIQTTPDAPDLLATSDSGSSNTDDITNDSTPTFLIGGTVSGATVELLRNGTPVASGVAAGSTIQLTDPGATGGPALGGVLHSYTARQTVSGGLSPESTALGVTVDTTNPTPSVPDLKPTTDGTDNDNGASTTDDRTNAASRDFTLTGSETGSTLALLRAGNPVSNPDTGALSDGVHQYSLRETDKAGNIGTSAALAVTFDSTAPSVTSVVRADANPTAAASVNFTVNFSEPVSGVDAADFVVFMSGGLTGANVTGVTPVTSTQYTVAVNTGTGDGNLRLDVVTTDAVTPIKDVMNLTLGAGFTIGEVYTVDRSNPTVLSINRQAGAQDPTGAASVNFTVTFSEAVSVATVDSGDFALTNVGVTGSTIGTITPATPTNSSVFTVAVNTGSNNGTIRLDLVDNDTIRDVVNKPLGGAGAGNGSRTGDQFFTIDKSVPTVVLSLAAGETDPTSNTTINFTAVFSEPVFNFTPSGVQITGTAGATVANITPVDSQTYTVGISGMTQSGSVSVTILAGAAVDNAANPNTASNPVSVTYIQDIFTAFEVNTTDDSDDGACTPLGGGGADCTLREAILLANADGGAETITFDPAVFTSPGPHVINLATALPDIATSMTIQGPGADVLTVQRNSGAATRFRIFTVGSGTTVGISGLTVSGGHTADGTDGLGGSHGANGGGILNAGTLTLTAVAVSGNRTGRGGNVSAGPITAGNGGNGGGISNAGTLTITSSTVSGNQTGAGGASSLGTDGAGGVGGGISNESVGTLSLVNSTVSGNQTGAGGDGGPAGVGGGIHNRGTASTGTLTITGSTITANTAHSGGGIYRNSGTVTLKSTIVAGNTTVGAGPDILDDVNSEGFNLIGNTSAATIIETQNAGTNQTNVSAQLVALANNGGPTQTHALQCTSPAIDKGYSFGQATDQRGLARVFDLADALFPNAAAPGDGTDIGSLETQSGSGCVPIAIPPTPATTTNEDTTVVITLTGTYAQNVNLSFTITDQPDHAAALTPSAPICNFDSGTPLMTCTSTVSYEPTSNYNGPDVFSFKVSAGLNLDSEAVDVPVTVNPVNDIPVANSQLVGTDEDTPVTITLTGSDMDTPAITFNIVTGPAHGTLGSISTPTCFAGNCSATVDYTPAANYGGPDSFTFKTNDGTADSNPVGTVTLAINPQNDAPVLDNTGAMSLDAIHEDITDVGNPGTLVSAIIASAGGNRITDVDAGASEGLAIIAVDENDGTWQYSANGGPWTPLGSPTETSARLLVANASTRVRFMPNANFNGTVNPGITFRAWDLSNGLGLNGTVADASAVGGTNPYSVATEIAFITVTPVNDAPTADSQTVATNEDTPLAVTLTGTDVETPASQMVFTITQQPTNGTLSGTGANRTYTPNQNYNGPDSFKFTITDTGDGTAGALTTAEATISITVNAVNDAPVNAVPGAQSVIENSFLTFSAAQLNPVSISDVDAGGSDMIVTLTATNGTISLSRIDGLGFSIGTGSGVSQMRFQGTIANINAALDGMVFTPTPGYDGAASLQIETSDQGFTGSGGTLTDTDTINITVLDGGVLAFSSATYTVDEAAGTMTITVNRTGGSNGEARVNYATSDGTAAAGVGLDYLSSSGQLIFANGETSKTFTITINNDTLDELDETVNLTLSNVSGSGAIGAPATAILTITDNDPPPTISISDVVKHEGNSGQASFDFTVTLSAASGLPVTVNYQTANGTATAPTDYQPIGSTLLTFNPGETEKIVTVLVNGDVTAEANETFFVNLSAATNSSISDGQGQATILSEDTPLVALTASTYSVDEDGLHAIVVVKRLGDLSQPARVDYLTSDPSGLNACAQVTGNASSRCDYATSAGTVRFAAGEETRQLFIPIVNDTYIEGPEVFTITLSNVVGGELDAPISAVITINDNDTGPAPHPLLSDEFQIRQFYIDFLGREPEPGAIQAWLGILNQCAVPTDCDRVAVAEGFVRSPEFQERGYFIYRFYSAALGRITTYNEFIPDMARVSGFLNPQDLEANKAAYIDEFMNRLEFKSLYDSTLNNPTGYVDKLLQTVGLPNHPARVAWINGLTNGTLTRAQVLRALVESTEVYTKFYNEAFIVMNYFGFLRRNPDAAFQVWIDTFNHTNNYKLIINGFLNAPEYGLRFGP